MATPPHPPPHPPPPAVSHSFLWPCCCLTCWWNRVCVCLCLPYRYLFALQIKQDVSFGRLTCNDTSAALMVSHIVQCKFFAERERATTVFRAAVTRSLSSKTLALHGVVQLIIAALPWIPVSGVSCRHGEGSFCISYQTRRQDIHWVCVFAETRLSIDLIDFSFRNVTDRRSADVPVWHEFLCQRLKLPDASFYFFFALLLCVICLESRYWGKNSVSHFSRDRGFWGEPVSVAPPQQQLHPGADAADRQDHGVSLQTHVSRHRGFIQVFALCEINRQRLLFPLHIRLHSLLLVHSLILNSHFWESIQCGVTKGK